MARLKKKTDRNPHTAHCESPDIINLSQVSARCYQNLFNNASDAIFIRDLKGNIIEVNEATVTHTGYTHNELTRMNVSEFLTAESFKLIMERQKALLEDETATQRYELEIIRKDGVRMNAESQTNLLTYKGQPLGVQCIVRDITERKRVEEALQFLSSVVEQAKDSVIVTNLNYKIEYVNKATEELFGYSREELIGLTPLILNAEPMAGDIQKDIYKTVSSGEVATGSILNKRKDGSTFVCEFKVSPLSDKDGRLLSYIGIQRDVTKRKRVEEELRKFKTISDRAGYGAAMSSPDGNLIYVNEMFARIHGYGVEELIGKHLSIFHTEEQMKLVERLNNQLIQTGSYAAEEVWHKKKDGTVFPTLMTGTAIKDNKGKPLYLSATVIDITERKRMEKALRVSEQNFRNCLDSSPLGIRIVTAEGKLLYANQAILDIYGCSSAEELEATPRKKRYTPESYAQHQERKERRKLGKPVPAHYEISIVRKDGEVRHLAVFRKEVIWNGETQFQAIYQDVTERKAVEMALRESKEFNSSLLVNSPNPVLVLNADGSIRYVNPALEKLTGFSSTELIGRKPPYPWWTEETRKLSSRRLAKAMLAGARKSEQLFRRKNGTRFWVETAFKTVKVDEGLKYHLVNWVDLTERKRLRENMEFYVSEITRAQEEERKRIAHEIHDESVQSLSVLALDIDAIAKEKERLPADIIQHLARLRAKTNCILVGLRAFSHGLRPGVIDLVGLVPALEILTEELNKSKRVNASLVITGSERRLAPEVELVLFRIAQEALRNVRRHSGATKTVMKVNFTQRKVRLTVSDNGGGFELPDMLSDLATEGKLGLIGMQERARLLDGSFLVKSQVGKGTIVVVEVAA